MENKAIDNILSRTSVRIYEEGFRIPDEDVVTIMRAAMSAPTAVNKQPWEFVVVDDRKLLASLASALPYAAMTARASMAVVVCGNEERFLYGTDNDLWVQDLSAASENILLAAHALGYGGVWTCVYPHDDRIRPVREILGLPEGIIPFNVIPVGKPSHGQSVKDKWNPSRIHHNRWYEGASE